MGATRLGQCEERTDPTVSRNRLAGSEHVRRLPVVGDKPPFSQRLDGTFSTDLAVESQRGGFTMLRKLFVLASLVLVLQAPEVQSRPH